ncbi:MAG TPA: FHA domain-containing protein [Actinomycetota bacterium]|nr:FHA domain-containing protein [Actinomycetota bacterium]
MPDLVLYLLKYAFLAVLYIFIARAVRAVYVELQPGATNTGNTGGARQAPRKAKKTPRKGVVIEGPAKGKSLDLNSELTIGRADKCHLVLDDTYVSQVHARIYPKGDTVVLEDLGSTNGTYLNRRRITSPSEVQRGDRVKIGKTVLELRK